VGTWQLAQAVRPSILREIRLRNGHALQRADRVVPATLRGNGNRENQ